jgi:cysteine-rich repeat protein
VAAVGAGVLVGAPGDDGAGPDAGSAWLFRTPADPAPLALRAPAAAPAGAFGAAVAALGEDLLVGAPGAGTVHLFRGVTGEPLLTLTTPGPARFGAAVAAAGDTILVGAPGAAGDGGRAFLYAAGSGEQLLALSSPVAEPGDEFGFAVASAGQDLLVAAPGAAGGAGAVFVFDGVTGAVRGAFAPALAGHRFGAALAVTEAGVLVGAPGDGGGAAYLFDVATGVRLRLLRREGGVGGFGAAVAGVGGRLAIGAPRDGAGAVGGGAVHLYDGEVLTAVFRRRLSRASFGASVVAAGDAVLGGAPFGERGSGAVYRYRMDDGALLERTTAPDASPSRFGFAIASTGTGVVAGAPFEDAGGARAGAAYVLAGGGARRLAAVTPLAGDQFGFAVAAGDGEILVGAPLAGPRDTGVAVLFGDAAGEPRITFQKPTPVTGDFFAAAVAMDPTHVLVGAPLDGATAPNAGAAYLFARRTAVLERTLAAPAGAGGDLFGAAVALDPSVIAVGAPLADAGAPDAGRVFVFDRATGALRVVIDNPSPGTGDQFGRSVAIVGARVLVGAPLDDAGAPDAGAAYLFDAADGSLAQTLLDPAQAAFDQFGFAVASGPIGSVVGARVASRLFVGAPGSSRVYAFRLTDTRADASPIGPRVLAAVAPATCGNGVVEPGEACDDGNAVDLDDCRTDCTRAICCTFDPLAAGRCDDGNPCTDDVLDPVSGCANVPNDRCCQADDVCADGKCRVCVGCFLYPWECCDGGATCLGVSPECAGSECLAAAYCECEGGLACADRPLPATIGALFTAACDQLRLEESLAPALAPSGRGALRTAKARTRSARKMTRKAARLTRKLAEQGAVSRECRTVVLGKIKTVKRAIPRGRQLRRCVLAR